MQRRSGALPREPAPARVRIGLPPASALPQRASCSPSACRPALPAWHSPAPIESCPHLGGLERQARPTKVGRCLRRRLFRRYGAAAETPETRAVIAAQRPTAGVG